MPTLNWIGKEAVVKHHKEVPFRLLELVPELSCGDADSGNLIEKASNRHRIVGDDRLIGGLWANLSGGRCRFVMVKEKRREWVEEELSQSPVRQN
jgi:hypothetical protein